VGLEFDPQQRDKYHPLLAYVYLADGRMLNGTIAEEGYAYPATFLPNARYFERFRAAVPDIRERGQGPCGNKSGR
jgi:endonuclease YncB( thermonuclease family)